MDETNKKHDGISLRRVHLWMIVGAAIISAVMFFSTYHLTRSFRHLAETSEQQIELSRAARELMDASDYLTEKAQRFTIDGDMRFMMEYFAEAFESQHREEAIEKMSEGKGTEAALKRLQDAMAASVSLMNREYYAMRLVIDAKGYGDYPEALRTVELSEEDRALSAQDKMHLATRMVLDDAYYTQKEEIRANMRASLDELERMAYNADASALNELHDEMLLIRVVILLQIAVMIIMVWLTSRLGINPVLNAVERIKADSPIPEVGAEEFRYLARAYNKMYEVYRNSLERLNFKASHDELTGAYNRAGYDLLMSSIDLNNTYMMLFDVDNFKSINDTYGHETGDKVLVKLVEILRRNFRTDDYICRIGGDEFVVFMVHSSDVQKGLIGKKIDTINRELASATDGLPKASISVGIVHGSEAKDAETLFEKTDAAMYESKKKGKSTYTFISGGGEGEHTESDRKAENE